ncbi:hypothetical protein T459_07913 [Capsicum annuum]|uniref:F-box domain-containing protein n=1 Tax=Capsicum annuum TaxID=4072 RepID=A0A2G2ZV08_CAPAN|nr:hypothetical protein T459_07913 [Capsicum annuum]
MPILPEELITETLLKLPVKSLLQFRFVCKSWLSLISSPQFVKAHLLLSSTNKDYTHHRVLCEAYYSNPDVRGCSVSSLLCDSVTEALDLDYHRKIFGAHPRLVGYINGLI